MSQSSNPPTNERLGLDRLTESARHNLLSSGRRRVLFDVLATRPAPLGVEEVALAVAEREAETDGVEPSPVESVALTLHHNHLPKLDNLGIVDYDPASHRIEFVDPGLVR